MAKNSNQKKIALYIVSAVLNIIYSYVISCWIIIKMISPLISEAVSLNSKGMTLKDTIIYISLVAINIIVNLFVYKSLKKEEIVKTGFFILSIIPISLSVIVFLIIALMH